MGADALLQKKIVEDHGGEIYVDRTCRAGTLFKVTIPFAAPQGPHPHISSKSNLLGVGQQGWRAVFTGANGVRFALLIRHFPWLE
jgi:hypothetical protein